MKGTSVTILALAVAILSCEPSPEVVNDLRGARYFPLETGAYWIYDVDSTHISQNIESTFKFQLMVSVTSSFGNSAGGTTYVLQRAKRSNSTEGWETAGTWSAYSDHRNAVLIEGNERFVQLQFPIEQGNQWNGNALNTIGGDDFCGNLACDVYSVVETEPDVVVSLGDQPDQLVKYDVRTETYRKDIGLVKKDITVLEYCTNQDCFGKQFVDRGIRYTQTLIEHGQI